MFMDISGTLITFPSVVIYLKYTKFGDWRIYTMCVYCKTSHSSIDTAIELYYRERVLLEGPLKGKPFQNNPLIYYIRICYN